jgi:Na+-transporting NADH:ubiquinone oxidoreductase subunit NqrB
MWAMALRSIVLFFRGKLFAEPRKAIVQLLIGILVTAVLFVVLAKGGAPSWLAALIAALVGGALQPFLLRNLRYA